MLKLKNYWYNLNDKIRFFVVGCINAFIAYVFYTIFCIILGKNWYQISLAMSWIISSFISFYTQRTFVFKGKGIWYKEYLKCCTTWFFSYVINAVLLEFFVRILGVNIFVSQIFSNLSAAIFTYIVFKIIVFKPEK